MNPLRRILLLLAAACWFSIATTKISPLNLAATSVGFLLLSFAVRTGTDGYDQ